MVSDDAFEQVLQPPVNETPEQCRIRLERDAEARRISTEIDAAIKQERQARRKRRIVRLLLLGQSESGAQHLLQQFQRLYTPTAFREERILWRAVIQLNIIRSIRTILDAVNSELLRRSKIIPSMSHTESHSNPSSFALFHSPLDTIQARLAPLRDIERLLVAKLVPPNEEEATRLTAPDDSSYRFAPRHGYSRSQEIFVRPGTGWKGALSKARVNTTSLCGDDPVSSSSNRRASASDFLETADEPQSVLHACAQDMIQLWQDPGVRAILRKKKLRLEESPGFFLNDLARVTASHYLPSEDDVLKARLKTVGVCEYKFEMEVNSGRDAAHEWRIVDVGGSRSQVSTWMPFFDDVDAIIFLAPISGFDQVLAEDRNVNRLEDSVLLWKAVCLNKLLANVDLVLFLNKCDILEAKLRSGIQLAKYVRSYGDRENTFDAASKYLRSKFSAIHREHSPNPRKFYAFCTSVTDTTTTAGIIAGVRDMVIRQHLKQSKLL
ncbi:G-alpha-domain-containing protein [Fistulina hepatica ATCC 64428]|uniref:G-alpha-domain-containing protein n=1 Tax=Fistulina hepatica ATCC 64428 TaxID=1128425 RepID=A0A0D7A8M0_9AGAR|nr:G-alpha-domain-containing protein [Fistulina hepatica ATCC 64428]